MTTEPFKLTVAMILFVVVALGGTALAATAGVKGWGLAKPDKDPRSVREGSMRRGRSGTIFFVTGGRGMRGGGLRGGK